jgi:hypothetical protein
MDAWFFAFASGTLLDTFHADSVNAIKRLLCAGLAFLG